MLKKERKNGKTATCFLKLHHKGLADIEIAKKLRITVQAIRGHRKRRGLLCNDGRKKIIRIPEIINLREKLGLTFKEIGKRIGRSEGQTHTLYMREVSFL